MITGWFFLVGQLDALENLEPTLDPEIQAMVGELGNYAIKVKKIDPDMISLWE